MKTLRQKTQRQKTEDWKKSLRALSSAPSAPPRFDFIQNSKFKISP